MEPKRWLQFAVGVLLLLNAGCDFDNSSHTFADTGIAKFDKHENDTVEDLELWTIPPETNEKGEVMAERNRNHLDRQPTQEELRESLDRINKVISTIEKALAAQ